MPISKHSDDIGNQLAPYLVEKLKSHMISSLMHAQFITTLQKIYCQNLSPTAKDEIELTTCYPNAFKKYEMAIPMDKQLTYQQICARTASKLNHIITSWFPHDSYMGIAVRFHNQLSMVLIGFDSSNTTRINDANTLRRIITDWENQVIHLLKTR